MPFSNYIDTGKAIHPNSIVNLVNLPVLPTTLSPVVVAASGFGLQQGKRAFRERLGLGAGTIS